MIHTSAFYTEEQRSLSSIRHTYRCGCMLVHVYKCKLMLACMALSMPWLGGDTLISSGVNYTLQKAGYALFSPDQWTEHF